MVLQPQDHLLAEGELVAEGEIIRSSVCCEFGGACISHAGAGGIGAHIGGGAAGLDEQPLIASADRSAQILVGLEVIAQFLGVFCVVGSSNSQAFAGDPGGLAQA